MSAGRCNAGGLLASVVALALAGGVGAAAAQQPAAVGSVSGDRSLPSDPDAVGLGLLRQLSDEEYLLIAIGAVMRMGCSLQIADNDALMAGLRRQMLAMVGLPVEPGPALAAEMDRRLYLVFEDAGDRFEVDATAGTARLRNCG